MPSEPGEPTISSVTKDSISLEWTAPRDDGGCPIDEYILEYKAEGAFKWQPATSKSITATRYTMQDLPEETSYDFRVAAKNKAGAGPFSGTSSRAKTTVAVGEWCGDCGLKGLILPWKEKQQ